MQKLEELNRTALGLFEEDHYPQAGVYWDEAERILEYAAGCGKTIERTLITTILNNQASLLQRTSELEQSANYLEAIIYNLAEFLQNHHDQSTPLVDPAELGPFLEKKQALALYQLRFCALSSHLKNNQTALETARKAMNTLKEVCKDEYAYENLKGRSSTLASKEKGDYQGLSETEALKMKTILKDLWNLRAVSEGQIDNFEPLLDKACQ